MGMSILLEAWLKASVVAAVRKKALLRLAFQRSSLDTAGGNPVLPSFGPAIAVVVLRNASPVPCQTSLPAIVVSAACASFASRFSTHESRGTWRVTGVSCTLFHFSVASWWTWETRGRRARGGQVEKGGDEEEMRRGKKEEEERRRMEGGRLGEEV